MPYKLTKDIRVMATGLVRGRGEPIAAGELPEGLFDKYLEQGIAVEVQPPPPPEPNINATDQAIELAEELGVDLATVTGSGQGGRILVGDVQMAAGGGG